MTRLPSYHAARWDEPLVLELGRPGRRGLLVGEAEPAVVAAVGAGADLVPEAVRRERPPALPELSEFEVQRHYLHLAQMTLGMMGVNLFGTCTMKYNPRLNEHVAARPWLAELHPGQDEETLQGVLEILHSFDLMLRELSGMARFVFQPGGGAAAAYTHACVTRAWLAARGELGHARRGDHDDPGAPVQRRDGRGRRLRGRHACRWRRTATRPWPRSRPRSRTGPPR